MQFEDLDPNEEVEEERPIAEESSNRTFLIIAGALGGIALLALICIAVYALVVLPGMQRTNQDAQATMSAQETETGLIVAWTATSADQTAIVAAYTATPTITPIPPSPTPTVTPTPVVAVPTTPAGPGPMDATALSFDNATATARYETLVAKVTENANNVTTPTIRTGQGQATAIPSTGFADEVGLPAMLGIAVVLVAVIFLARRLRTA